MTPLSVLNRLLYWPICRAYARFIIGDSTSDFVQRFLCTFQFWQVHRFWPDFINPRRFSEKIWRRMFFDRNPLLTQISDKFQVREYVSKRVGHDYLIPLLWHGDDANQIPLDMLPDKFVIKASHGSGYNVLVMDKAKLNLYKVRRQLDSWLDENFCTDRFLGTEWGYKNIKPILLIESMIEEDGETPKDYKFWCFSGQVECISVHFNRFTEHAYRSFDRSLEPIDFGFGPTLPVYRGRFEKPANLGMMLEIAESLAEGFGFMRVDLYSLPTHIYFGELTPYPGGVSVEIVPKSWDLKLGEKWKGL